MMQIEPNKIIGQIHDIVLHRRLALLGGTSTLGDCMVAFRKLLSPRKLVEGPAILEFEKAFAKKINMRYAYSFCSGRVGLYGLLKVLGVGPGDEVLLQVPTHIVVANAIRYLGARPVYVDCCLDTYNMDFEKVTKKITPNVKALILQHTFGIPADIDAALDLSHRFGFPVIEDCVHALGARYNGRQVGTFGRAAFFSTEETKIISTTMGGVVVTNDCEIAEKMSEFQKNCLLPSEWLTYQRILKFVLYHFLMEPHLHLYTRAIYELLGRRHPLPKPTTVQELAGQLPLDYERRLSNAQAAIGLRQLQNLKTNIAHRRAISEIYKEGLAELGFKIPKAPEKADPAFVRFPLWVEDRDRAIRILALNAVLGTWFTSVLEEADAPSRGDYQIASCPNAELASRHLVNLPTHMRVKISDALRFVDILGKFMVN